MKPLLGFLLCLFCGVTATAQMAQPGTWVPNQRVKHITRGDGKVFMSGDFDWFGEYYEGNAPVFNTDLSHDSSYPPMNLRPEKAIPDGAGGWYTASYGTIGHIKADKTAEILPVNINTTGAPIYGIALLGTTLYFVGQFSSVNGTPRANVAAIDVTTNTLTSWNPGTNGSTYSLAIFGSTVYVGGSFSTVGGLTRHKIAAIDATTGVTTSWNANVISSFGYVLDIIPTATTVYFGGSFTNVGGGSPTRRNFAAVNSTAGALTTFNPRPDQVVRDLLLDGTTLYVAGGFQQIAAVTKYGLAALDTSTGSLTSFSVTFPDTYNGPVTTMAIDGQKLFIGGDFAQINGVDKARLAVVDKTKGVLEPTVPRNISGLVQTISIVGSKVLVGCYSLLGINGEYSSLRVQALDETTGQGMNWTPQIPFPSSGWGIVDTQLHYQDNRLYYLQDLYYAPDGSEESVLGVLNSSDGTNIPGWSVAVNDIVTAWAFTDNALYLAGKFTSVNGTARDGFAAVDLITGAVLGMNISPSYSIGDNVSSMVVANSILYAAGDFSFMDGGVQREGMAAWHTNTGVIQPWAPQDVGGAQVGAAHNGKVYLIGDIAMRVDAVTGLADGWTPDYFSNTDYGYVNSLVLAGTYAYIVGGFNPGVTRVGVVSGNPTFWQPSIEDVYDSEGQVYSLAVSSTKLYVVGNFSFQRADGQQSHYAQFDLPIEVPNEPPQIAATTSALPSDGVVSIDLTKLISDPDGNLDLTTLSLLSETTAQGAAATIDESFTLILDYVVPFSGTDMISIEVCDLAEACTLQELSIEVGGMDLMIYNAVSPNGDGKNDELTLLNISPNNKVTIFNRWGAVVSEIDNYDNQTRVFRGLSSNGSELAQGTYYYRIDFLDGQATRTGYISLRR